MTRRSLFLAGAFLAGALCGVGAASVDAATARQAAEAWLARGGAPSGLAGRSVSAVETLSDGAARMHVAKLAGGGYVVLPTDDLIAPVIAFSAAGDAPGQDARNPLWALLTQDLACRAAAAGAAAASPPSRALAAASPSRTAEQQRWDELLGASQGLLRAAPSVSDPRVDPLVSTRWGQDAVGAQNVYNFYTPSNYPCGCVATATAQIMKYHRYPAGAVSAGNFDCTVDGVAGNFTMKGGIYDWANMPDAPTADDITETQARAIGKLTYDIGCSVGMAWTERGSGASIYSARLRLTDVFEYKSCEGVVFTDNYEGGEYPYTLACCKQVTIPCLDFGIPLIMAVSGAGGHAVVIDGYGYSGDDFYLHVNCGWDGACDAWYCPPDLTMGPYAFTAIDGFLYNILPQATGTIVSGRVLDDDGAPVADVTVALRRSGVDKATARTNARGIYAVLAPNAGSYKLVATYDSISATQEVVVVANNSRQLIEAENNMAAFYIDAAHAPVIGNTYANDFRFARARRATETTSDVPVPYDWLDAFYPGAGTSAAGYESLGNACGANGLYVWQCYLAGLDPTNAESRLVASIRIEDGAPVVTWTPVSAVSEDLGYVYRVKGKATLDDGSWSATNAASRFFKVFLEKK